MSSQLVWLITGTSSGLGRELALAALKRGDKVIATARARSISQLDDLKKHANSSNLSVLELDITATLEVLKKKAKDAVGVWGRVDVLVNNAGAFSAVGAMEELTPEETFAQFNVGLFASINVSRAFLPYMRECKTGKIIWIGSLSGWQPMGILSMYSAVKHAMRAVSECLDDEIKPLGLRSICLEPGMFRTKFLESGNRGEYTNRIADYRENIGAMAKAFADVSGKQVGDPVKFCHLTIDLVRGEGVAAGKAEVPRTLQVGSDTYAYVKGSLEERLRVLEEWKEVIVGTDVDA